MEKTRLNNKIYTLDILRIVAALSVFIFHLKLHCHLDLYSKILNKFFINGAIFMVLFFMLSGFLLYYTNQNKNIIEKENLFEFIKKRFIRIYPSYFVYLIIIYILDKTTLIKKVALLPGELLLQQSFYPSANYNVGNAGTWFVSTVFALYLCFPYLQHIVKNMNIKTKYIIATMLFFAVYPSVILGIFRENITMIYSNPIFRIPEFVIGMCIAKLYLENKDKNKNKDKDYCLLYTIGSTIGLVLAVKILAGMGFNGKFPLFNIAVVPMFGLIIYFTSLIKDKKITKLCSSKFIQYCSNISFSFYLVQGLSFHIYYVFINNFKNLLTIQVCLILFILNCIFSIFLYEFGEKYLSNLLRNKFLKKFN